MKITHPLVSTFWTMLLVLIQPSGGLASAETIPPEAQSVQRVPRAEIIAISRAIDKLVGQQLAEREQDPNPLADDETFLRRIYLDAVGRIPTLEEATSFLDSKAKGKRSRLIDQLLDSEGYVSHQFNYWADVLRVKSRLQGGNPGQPYVDFIKSSLAANLPFDAFVRQLLSAEGSALERGNGATGYFLRDRGMPEDNMANTVRIFLGTRLECAQCHDHPFDKWTQREFFEMVAFMGGMQWRLAPRGAPRGQNMRRQIRLAEADAQVKQVARNLLRPLSYGVSGGGTALARLPDTYQYDDGEPNELITAKTMFGRQQLVHPTIPSGRARRPRPGARRFATNIPGAVDIGSRVAFAEWLTSDDNPRFAMVIANRLWKKTMGLGLIEPVDDIMDETVPSNEPLMAYLTRQMVQLEFDTKQFLRVLYNSKTYQREASAAQLDNSIGYAFPGPLLRRMSAEQLWDSFLTLAVPDLDGRENPRTKIPPAAVGGDLYMTFENIKDMSVDEILELAEQQIAMRNDPQQRRRRYRDAMMSAQASNKYQDEAVEIRRQLAGLKRTVAAARRQGNKQAVEQLRQRMRELSNMLRHIPARVAPDFVRASELPSPAPPGHFLREFGQSDRDQIENANHEPAVNQVLSLMNGQIEKRIIDNPRTVLMRNVVVANGTREKIDVIFLSMLSRLPSRDEKRTWLDFARNEGGEAAHDLIWTLANSSEFLFIQ